jgi:phospholipid-binding lipoprotein MlaA
MPPMHSISEVDDEFVGAELGADPWEGFNRSMYKFNYYVDKYALLPVVNTYEFITPTVAQTGVSNFFNNIGEIRTLYNSMLQLKGEKSLITTGRFIVNSTIGIIGLFDVATQFGLKRENEDFGQTLAVWGVGRGPYLVVPVLGPGTVRSTSGFVVDAAIHAAIKDAIDLPDRMENGDTIQTGVTILKVVDNRHQQPFRYYDNGYPFEYEMVRFLFRQKRELEAMK